MTEATAHPALLVDYGDVLTAGEVAEILHVSTRTVYRLAQAGEIPNRKVGHRLYFARAKLIDALGLGGEDDAK